MALDNQQPATNENANPTSRDEARVRVALSVLNDVQEVTEPTPGQTILGSIWPRQILTDAVMTNTEIITGTDPLVHMQPINELDVIDGFGEEFFGADHGIDIDVLPGMEPGHIHTHRFHLPPIPPLEPSDRDPGTTLTYNGVYDRQARNLHIIRRKYLTGVNEQRTDITTFKKYLMITVKSSEAFDLSVGKISTLVRKYVPEWVLNEVASGRSVDAFIRISWNSPAYFKYMGSQKLIKLTSTIKRSVSSRYDVLRLNGYCCAKLKINTIIKTEVDRNGIYSDDIKTISELSKTSIEDLTKFGKIKPIYLLNVSDFEVSEGIISSETFLSKFKLIKTSDDSAEPTFTLDVIKVLDHWKQENMSTVWI